MKSRFEYESVISRWRALPRGSGELRETRCDIVSPACPPFMEGRLTREAQADDAAWVGAEMIGWSTDARCYLSMWHTDAGTVVCDLVVRRELDAEDGPAHCDETARAAGVGA